MIANKIANQNLAQFKHTWKWFLIRRNESRKVGVYIT